MANAKVSPSPVRFHLDELEKSLHALEDIQLALEKMALDSSESRMAWALRCVLLSQAQTVETLAKFLTGGETNVVH